jgi:beta-glucosidase
MGDFGSSRVHPPGHVTPLDGIRAAFGRSEITHVDGDDPARAAAVAGQADVAMIIVGYDGHDEGEYLDPAGMATPELLALLPPLPPGEALPALDAGGTA